MKKSITNVLKDVLRNANTAYQKINTFNNVFKMCDLSNNYLLCLSGDGFMNELTVYDDNFRVLHKKNTPSISVTTDMVSKVYLLSDFNIKITDFELNEIQSISTYLSGYYQFNEPTDICYSNKSLYICDTNNKRIQVLINEQLDFKSFNLDYKPHKIKIAGCTACVTPFNIKCLYFYDLETFMLKNKYNHHCGILSVINDQFYEYCNKIRSFNCYNNEGLLLEKFEVTAPFDSLLEKNKDGQLTLFNQDLLILSSDLSNGSILIVNDYY